MKIESFTGIYGFLSNFYPVQINADGLTFPTLEHAFQAAKTLNHREVLSILEAPTPGIAKRRGKKVNLRPNWNQIKDSVMLNLLRKKFMRSDLKDALLNTGDAELIEGNNWGDVYWGVCNSKGENKLGKLLMQVREELRKSLPEEKMSDKEAGEFLEALDNAANQLMITTEEEQAAAKKHCTPEQIQRYWKKQTYL